RPAQSGPIFAPAEPQGPAHASVANPHALRLGARVLPVLGLGYGVAADWRPALTKQPDNISREKALCFDYLDRNARAIATLNDSIFYFGELGMQEYETAKLMSGLLEEGGFKVERGISGFPTGFCATYGSSRP